jgi:class 3 adenylate cyclase
MPEPETRYARSGDLHIAYQTVGEGPIDLAFIPGFAWHIEYQWQLPDFAAFIGRLTTFARVITFDKRGTGLSDPVATTAMPTLEERMDDLRAVLDAVGSRQAAVIAFWEGGPMSILFAATHPERTRGLVLYAPPVAFRQSADYPWAGTPDTEEARIDELVATWGRETLLSGLAPSVAGDERVRRLHARLERFAASPGAVRALMRMNFAIDVRDVLPSIRVPTLVLHRRGDAMLPVAAGRWVAERIPGARFVQLAGDDHLPWYGDADAVIGEIRQFLTGARGEPEADRVLATILFTDIVGSTERARALGDRRWRSLLDAFHERVRSEVDRFRGLVADVAGDGMLATFDGPARAIRCAEALHDAVGALDLRLRSGLHTGECERGGDRVAGIAVHIGARVAAEAAPGEVLVSRTVRDLVAGSGLAFDSRGSRALRGVPGEWELFAVKR